MLVPSFLPSKNGGIIHGHFSNQKWFKSMRRILAFFKIFARDIVHSGLKSEKGV